MYKAGVFILCMCVFACLVMSVEWVRRRLSVCLDRHLCVCDMGPYVHSVLHTLVIYQDD